MRVNGVRVSKPATSVKPGDVMTFVQGRAVKVVRMTATAKRRGPAPEAQALYDDQSPPVPAKEDSPARVGPRPTKKNRRDLAEYRVGLQSQYPKDS